MKERGIDTRKQGVLGLRAIEALEEFLKFEVLNYGEIKYPYKFHSTFGHEITIDKDLEFKE